LGLARYFSDHGVVPGPGTIRAPPRSAHLDILEQTAFWPVARPTGWTRFADRSCIRCLAHGFRRGRQFPPAAIPQASAHARGLAAFISLRRASGARRALVLRSFFRSLFLAHFLSHFSLAF